jgi:hypothetical protein
MIASPPVRAEGNNSGREPGVSRKLRQTLMRLLSGARNGMGRWVSINVFIFQISSAVIERVAGASRLAKFGLKVPLETSPELGDALCLRVERRPWTMPCAWRWTGTPGEITERAAATGCPWIAALAA